MAVWGPFEEESSMPVLVLVGRGGVFDMFTARYYPGDEDESNRWVLCGRDGYRENDVTHWRWLPTVENLDGVAREES
jgi:hypothetical protein